MLSLEKKIDSKVAAKSSSFHNPRDERVGMTHGHRSTKRQLRTRPPPSPHANFKAVGRCCCGPLHGRCVLFQVVSARRHRADLRCNGRAWLGVDHRRACFDSCTFRRACLLVPRAPCLLKPLTCFLASPKSHRATAVIVFFFRIFRAGRSSDAGVQPRGQVRGEAHRQRGRQKGDVSAACHTFRIFESL